MWTQFMDLKLQITQKYSILEVINLIINPTPINKIKMLFFWNFFNIFYFVDIQNYPKQTRKITLFFLVSNSRLSYLIWVNHTLFNAHQLTLKYIYLKIIIDWVETAMLEIMDRNSNAKYNTQQNQTLQYSPIFKLLEGTNFPLWFHFIYEFQKLLKLSFTSFIWVSKVLEKVWDVVSKHIINSLYHLWFQLLELVDTVTT